MQEALWIAAAGCVLVAVASGLADRRRWRRGDMNRVGLMPWPLVQVLALIGAVMCAYAALRLI